MAGKDRRRKWKRNCQRMCDRAEHSDSWGVTPAYRTPSSFFLKSYMYFGLVVWWVRGGKTECSWSVQSWQLV